jgi:hypothetical protein
MFCINSLSSLGYGSCSIVNLFSQMTTKLDLSGDLSKLTCPENEAQIITQAGLCDVFIWAVGSITNNYKKVLAYQNSLFKGLLPYKDKIHVICDSSGKEGLHPLTPSLRNKPWELVKFVLPEPPIDKTDADVEDNKKVSNDKQKK